MNVSVHARAVVTDIEGTVGSIAFVRDVLFPYARERLPPFIAAHADDPDVRRWLDAAAQEAGIDDPMSRDVVETLQRWMDEDRKATPLKAIQGMIWRDGYERGAYKAHIYPEVKGRLQRWHAAGVKLFVYSSGSIAAQQLFFAHTEGGDLSPCFDGWFDTTTGSKRERDSYTRIVDAIGLTARAIVFLSDTGAELDAAREAGMQTIRVCRPPTQCAGRSAHPCVVDFDAIALT